jgi:hypothetical protein
MEQLHLRNAHFPNSLEELTIAQLHSVLGSLAMLHGSFWESERFETDLAWLPTTQSGGMEVLGLPACLFPRWVCHARCVHTGSGSQPSRMA